MLRRLICLVAFCIGVPLVAPAGEDQYFDSNGVKIHFVVEGQGEPVIVVHGFMASIALMEQQLPGVLWKMSQDYQVVALDNRGHGKSDKPHDPDMYGLEMVNDVLRLMDFLKLEKAHIVGYSLGGFMTEFMLVHHSDRMLTATIGGMGWIKADDESMTFIVSVADSLDAGNGIAPYVERMWPVGQPKPSREQLRTPIEFCLTGCTTTRRRWRPACRHPSPGCDRRTAKGQPVAGIGNHRRD